MKRFFGMMPSSEIKREERFSVSDSIEPSSVTIQAGENGWTILYADHSSEYKDEVDTTDNNFSKAVEVLKTRFDSVKKEGRFVKRRAGRVR